ncbi:hypothetical protein P3T76_005170 [Phytophthora citrophthora]|uniref:RxLR effector protein n=1 Tax=Phytophthora citrophthora TaxID=4793 RepID=A0AAD9GSI2_9STRA|nr:hypothetical protein P3T76_005170 [Phytophthora citrophthora]
MRLYFLLLVAVVLAITDALKTTTESRQLQRADQSTSVVYARRSLRLATKSNVDAVLEDSTDTEERAPSGGLSSLKSKISDKIPLKVKLAWWQHFVNKPTEYVKNRLGANHPLYLKFKHTREENDMWTLASRSSSTFEFWKKQGLEGKITLDEKMSFDQIAAGMKQLEGTAPFEFYKRYANKFDDHRISNFGSGYYRDTYFIDKSASVAEKFARAQFWAESKRSNEYVKEFLGLLKATPDQISKNPYYQYYFKTFEKLYPKERHPKL